MPQEKGKSEVIKTRLNYAAKEFYTPEDIAEIDYTRDIGNPSEYPFTRGVYRDMYRGRLWTMRELVGFGTPEDTREKVKALTKEGTTGLAMICDLPTYLGIEPDHPLAEAAVGLEGIPFYTLRDMETFLDGIPMESENPNIVISTCTAPIVMAQYLAVAQQRGLDITKLKGNILNEPIKAHYTCYTPTSASYKLDLCLKTSGDIVEFCLKNMPRWNPINIQFFAFVYGVDIPTELAIGFGIAEAHIEEALRRGIDIDEIAPKMSFLGPVTTIHILEDIAKLRATRRMWAGLMKEKYNARSPRSWGMRIAVHTGTVDLFPQEPLNNIVRLTLESLAAVLGGCQSLEVCCYDEPISLPTEESSRTSLRIQQILAYETGLTKTADPLGGSYYIEYLTNEIERQTNEVVKEMDDRGGIIGVIESGWLDRKLEESCARYQKELDIGERIRMGVNKFRTPVETQTIVGVHRTPPKAAEIQLNNWRNVKENRDNEKVRDTLQILFNRAQEKKENLMPYILESVKTYATTAEIYGTIREAFGYCYDPLETVESPFKR